MTAVLTCILPTVWLKIFSMLISHDYKTCNIYKTDFAAKILYIDKYYEKTFSHKSTIQRHTKM